MNRLAKLLTLTVLCAVAVSAMSAAVTGKWNGQLAAKFSPPVGAGSFSPDQVKEAQSLLNGVRITLTINADGTYSAVTKGPNQPDQTTKGKWTLKGKTLTLTPTGKKPDSEVGTLSADGKSLSMSLPKNMTEHGVTGRAIFKKG